MLKNLFTYRRYLLGSFWADFRYRYAGTTLGLFWFIVNPLLEALIYTIVFSQLIGFRTGGTRGVAYTLFLITGLFPWLTFSQTITRVSNSLNAESVYLRRLPIPSDVFVAKGALVSTFSLLVYMIVLIPINLLFGNSLSWTWFLVPVMVVLIGGLGFGISLILAHLRVFFPDIGEILGVLVQLWRWTLPINFSIEIFPDWLRSFIIYNPPYYFITSFRDLIIDKHLPSIVAWIHMIVWTLIFVTLGSIISKRLGSEVKDKL